MRCTKWFVNGYLKLYPFLISLDENDDGNEMVPIENVGVNELLLMLQQLYLLDEGSILW